MSSPAGQPHNRRHNHIGNFLQTTSASFSSFISSSRTSPPKTSFSFKLPDSPVLFSSQFEPTQPDSISSNPTIESVSSAESSSGFPSTVRIARLNSNGKGGGPAFVGQVFSMCDLSGTGLMAVSTHFDIPFISKRTPKWLKKMFATITKSERSGPVFRFFMDLGDAVTYVKQLNIPSGVVGACRLDSAYEQFKEKPHLFQFVPNEKQVKEANKLLKTIPGNGGRRKVEGVPVFGAQNLDIAIATADGIKWYTPYFFDKNMLDNILEESVDQHFHGLIQTRHMQRRRDVIDDSIGADVMEEMGDSVWEPPEVQEVLDEIGHPQIPFSVIKKAAEIQLLYAVDKTILGNRWLRKATGIQPKLPYLVDSFERRSAASFQRASESTSRLVNSEIGTSELKLEDELQGDHERIEDLRLPFFNRFNIPWLKRKQNNRAVSDRRMDKPSTELSKQNLLSNPFLPKITMVGVSTGEAGQMSKTNLKKTMEDLTRELEQSEQGNNTAEGGGNEFNLEDRDPLFVANVGDNYSSLAKTGSPRLVRGGIN